MTLVITTERPIAKIFGFDAPPEDQRDGIFMWYDYCPVCDLPTAKVERGHIGGIGEIRRLVCTCGYWEWRFPE